MSSKLHSLIIFHMVRLLALEMVEYRRAMYEGWEKGRTQAME
jgi:predicted phage tail protein